MAAKMERIEARVEHDRAERIRYAASLRKSSVSSFVMDAAEELAERVIADHSSTTANRKFFDEVLRLLDEPAREIASLKRAASRSKVVRKRRG